MRLLLLLSCAAAAAAAAAAASGGRAGEVAVARGDSQVPFGAAMQQFFLMQRYLNLNHGAFGAVAAAAATAEHAYYSQMEADANLFFRGGYQPVLQGVRERLAAYVNANASDLVLVENASSGINAVLRALADTLPLRAGDCILQTTAAYPMVKNVIAYLARVRGLCVVNVTITFPVASPDDIVQPVKAALAAAGSAVRIAVFDHIASYPSVVFPIQQLAALAHAYGALVVVDGAHVLGQIPLDLQAVGADAYVTNAHKWFYSPKGTCLLWVRPALQQLVLPTVLSGSFDGDGFQALFQYTGTRNYCAFLAVGAALDFRQRIGDAAIYQYIHDVAWQGALSVASIFNTSLLVPNEAMNGALVSIVLPTNNGTAVQLVAQTLLRDYNTYIQTSAIDGVWYVRISGQIYLEVSDFTLMAQRFLALLRAL
jgi:isopenicillin-N epimerase